MIETTPWDSAKYLQSDEAVESYLQDAFDSGDTAEVADALGVIARVKGMTKIAEQAGLSRTALYRTLSAEGRPELSTLLKVMRAMNLRLTPVTIKPAA